MVTRSEPEARPPWEAGHFVGGHPILDLANTVFDRAHPAPDNELLDTASAVLTWCQSVGLVDDAPTLSRTAARRLPAEVRAVREQAWAVFDALARGEAAPSGALAALLERSGAGLRTRRVRGAGADPGRLTADWSAPAAIPAALSLLAVQALFTLPAERVRACDRCGWLFLDSSRGGRRRWCSMSTCGNREKATRHRHAARSAS